MRDRPPPARDGFVIAGKGRHNNGWQIGPPRRGGGRGHCGDGSRRREDWTCGYRRPPTMWGWSRASRRWEQAKGGLDVISAPPQRGGGRGHRGEARTRKLSVNPFAQQDRSPHNEGTILLDRCRQLCRMAHLRVSSEHIYASRFLDTYLCFYHLSRSCPFRPPGHQ